ncbi:hypothetical protein [Streptococcus mitis]|uniref:hypothetical protein n=1 Tax=Streptococcus mitis TaxID=28037 RepID=UPI0021B6B4E1|nr:hypothetical protein [Streptococcus mitis]
MTENYLPIKESLGYKNIKIALWNVFKMDLDNLQIEEGLDYENFVFPLYYNGYKATIILSGTGKHIQFEYGEGGRLTISLPNPKYPKESFLESIFFHNLISDKHLSEHVEYAFGKDEQSLERALKILKDFLDSDEAKVLLKHE